MFKITDNIAPETICCMFTKQSTVHDHCTGLHSVFYSSASLYYIAYQRVVCWNYLLLNVICLKSYAH